MENTNTELMPLIKKGDELLVDGRLLHKMLKVGTNFRHWIVARITEYNFEEGKDFFRAGKAPGYKSSQAPKKTFEIKNGVQIEYSLTLDMAKELAMIERNETGKMFRRYFITKEKEARVYQLGIAPPPDVFNGMPHETLNGTTLYLYTPMLEKFGYSPNSSGNGRRERYPNHFIKLGSRVYITKVYAEHLYRLSVTRKSRVVVKAAQPILSADFGKPIELF